MGCGAMWAATGAKPALGQVEVLRVGVAGSEPFVVKEPAGLAGVAVEIWEGLAAKAGGGISFDLTAASRAGSKRWKRVKSMSWRVR